MAIIENPLSRKERKALGNIQYYVRYGKYTLRSKPLFIKNPKTPAQQAQRMRVKKFAHLYRQVRACIYEAYSGLELGMSAYCRLMSINVKNAFVANTSFLDPSLFVLCDNEGSFVNNVVLKSMAANTITGTFDSNAQTTSEEDDPVKAYGLYADENKIWRFDQFAIRRTGTITLTQADLSKLDIAVFFECLDRGTLVNGNPKHVIKYVGTIKVM
jgi:hypothetical protein